MSASTPSHGQATAETELLARLGLPPSASPEDVDQLHLAVSQFLAAAPAGLKGWARAQAAALDEAYLQLTDPVGLEGSALRSPTRPPTVVPGGPVTPPARRDSVPAAGFTAGVHAVATPQPVDEPAAPAASEAAAAATVDDTDTDDLDALFASVTPGAHRDMTSGGRPERAPAASVAAGNPAPSTAPGQAIRSAGRAPSTQGTATTAGSRRHTRATSKARAGAAPAVVAAPPTSGPWKVLAILASAGFALVAIAFVIVLVYNLGASGNPVANASAAPSVQTVDMAKIAQLMGTLQANPQDTTTMQSIGDTYFDGGDYANAGTFYDKILAINAKDEKALLARGAVYFNSGDPTSAQKEWQQVVALDPKSQEAHYDLGFLYMSQPSPDWTKVTSEWNTVISIDPTTALAQNVQQHLTSLAQQSMIPAASGAAASGSPAASGAEPSASGAAASSSAAPAASGSAQPSAAASASPASSASAKP